MLKLKLVPVLFSMKKGQVARMLMPSPMMYGFNIPVLGKFGPRDENKSTSGVIFSPIMVPLNKISEVGFAVELIYDFIFNLAT